MNAPKIFFLLVPFVIFLNTATAQSGKGFYKEGEKLREENQLEQAIEKYNLAIQVEPTMLKAYDARANVYELLGKKAECAADRKKQFDHAYFFEREQFFRERAGARLMLGERLIDGLLEALGDSFVRRGAQRGA